MFSSTPAPFYLRYLDGTISRMAVQSFSAEEYNEISVVIYLFSVSGRPVQVQCVTEHTRGGILYGSTTTGIIGVVYTRWQHTVGVRWRRLRLIGVAARMSGRTETNHPKV